MRPSALACATAAVLLLQCTQGAPPLPQECLFKFQNVGGTYQWTPFLGGNWYDSEHDSVLSVVHNWCALSPSTSGVILITHGATGIEGSSVSHYIYVNGTATLHRTGQLIMRLGTIRWSDGFTWSRGMDMVESRLTEQMNLINHLTERNLELEKAVERVAGAIATLVRQHVTDEIRTQQRVRMEGNSGLTTVRGYTQGTDAYQTATHIAYGAANCHNHANYRTTIGLGELQAVLNGVQFQTRHNDYKVREPAHKTVQEYNATWPPPLQDVVHTPVPPEVLAKATVEEQIDEMREFFRAFHNQDVSHRDYRPYFPSLLCYIEGAWTVQTDELVDPFSSDRHQIDADTWKELYGRNLFMFNSGQKQPNENMPFLPTAIVGQRKQDGKETYEPKQAQWFYRIACIKLKDDLPTARLRVKNELHAQMFGATPRTRERLSQTRKALYELNPALDAVWNPKAAWPKSATRYNFLDSLMGQIPGMDGPSGYLVDQAFGPMLGEFADPNTVLNTAFYTRYYALQNKDAMGRTPQKRAYNDYLFTAQTQNSHVLEIDVCANVNLDDSRDPGDQERTDLCLTLTENECNSMKWNASMVGGNGTGAYCLFVSNRCRYKKCWAQRHTYAIPLEIIYLNPLINWNPYELDTCSNPVPNGETGSYEDPYVCARETKYYYRTPAQLFDNLTDVDPADTDGEIKYVLDENTTNRAVRASGHRVLMPSMVGVGVIRQRYPIYPVHDHGSTTWKELKALEELVVGQSRPEIRNILLETRSFAYAIELIVLNQGSHEHVLTIPPTNAQRLYAGTDTTYTGVTNTGNGHQHRMKIAFDKDSGVFELVWCAQGPHVCPGTLVTGCSQSPSCCIGSCPDGHSGVDPVI